MKKILLLILLFVSVNVFSQPWITNPNLRKLNNKNSTTEVDGRLKFGENGFFTLPVSDTIHALAIYTGSLIYREADGQIYKANGSYWEGAFSVDLTVMFPAATNAAGDTLFFRDSPGKIPFAGDNTDYTSSDSFTYSQSTKILQLREGKLNFIFPDNSNARKIIDIKNDADERSGFSIDVFTGGIEMSLNPLNSSWGKPWRFKRINTVDSIVTDEFSHMVIDLYDYLKVNTKGGSIAASFIVSHNNTNLVTIKSTGDTYFGDSTAISSAKVIINSTSKGFLTPRMTTVQRAAISSPAEGLEVYDLTQHAKLYFDGTRWTGFRYNGTKFQGFDGTTWVDLN